MIKFYSFHEKAVKGIQRKAFCYAEGEAEDVVRSANERLGVNAATDVIGYVGEFPEAPGTYPAELYGLPAVLIVSHKDSTVELVNQ